MTNTSAFCRFDDEYELTFLASPRLVSDSDTRLPAKFVLHRSQKVVNAYLLEPEGRLVVHQLMTSIRILYVDDNNEHRDLVADALEQFDERFDVILERGASGAIDRLAADDEAVHCLISEYELPDQTGLELLATVREEFPQLPFILFTGVGSEALASEAISMGVTEYLPKRYEKTQHERLGNRILDAVSQSRVEQDRDRVYEALEAATQGISILDADGRYRYVNDAFADLYNCTPEEILGEHWTGLYPEPEVTRFQQEVRPRLDETDMWMGRCRGMTVDGTIFPERASVTQLDTGGYVCVVRPVTELDGNEPTLEQQNEQLDRFVSVVSHDLRNPLNVAIGRTELLQNEYDSEHLTEAQQALDRMAELIDDLLTLARNGQRVDDISPASLAANAKTSWQHICSDDSTLIIDTDLVIRADRCRLQQLFENLLQNAIDHGGDGVTITVGSCEDGFYVADDGPSIPEDRREKIFEAGYSTHMNGTGIGLSIVADIATAHGWKLKATESEAGGARFEITGVEIVDR
ncbi:response regulator [Halogeometricum borinquense]|uniref:histidine kinase n=1 Tax=Halogeometricum borinquense TaxID=60847 RepID=A0A6C0UK30_9EURY|nr:response regulator [Halogeometricum borinquense]